MKAAKNFLPSIKLESFYFGIAVSDMVLHRGRERNIKENE
jgi:hypothetical protein